MTLRASRPWLQVRGTLPYWGDEGGLYLFPSWLEGGVRQHCPALCPVGLAGAAPHQPADGGCAVKAALGRLAAVHDALENAMRGMVEGERQHVCRGVLAAAGAAVLGAHMRHGEAQRHLSLACLKSLVSGAAVGAGGVRCVCSGTRDQWDFIHCRLQPPILAQQAPTGWSPDRTPCPNHSFPQGPAAGTIHGLVDSVLQVCAAYLACWLPASLATAWLACWLQPLCSCFITPRDGTAHPPTHPPTWSGTGAAARRTPQAQRRCRSAGAGRSPHASGPWRLACCNVGGAAVTGAVDLSLAPLVSCPLVLDSFTAVQHKFTVSRQCGW